MRVEVKVDPGAESNCIPSSGNYSPISVSEPNIKVLNVKLPISIVRACIEKGMSGCEIDTMLINIHEIPLPSSLLTWSC